MVFENLQCPACGVMNTVDVDKSTFTCLGCGKEAITQAAAAFTDDQEQSIRNAPLARTVASNDDERKMLRRASMFLEDEDWPRAWSYYESILDYNPENAQAYIGELLVKLRMKSPGFLSHSLADFSGLIEYKRAIRFADKHLQENLQKQLNECRETIDRLREKLETRRESPQNLNGLNSRASQSLSPKRLPETKADKFKGDPRAETYDRAKRMMRDEKTREGFLEAARLFESLGYWEDSYAMAQICKSKMSALPPGPSRTKADKLKVDSRAETYDRAKRMMRGADTREGFLEAARLFESLGYWEDSYAMAQICKSKMSALPPGPSRTKADKLKVDSRAETYYRAKQMMRDADTREAFLEAAWLFESLDGHENSHVLAAQCRLRALDY